MKKLTHFLLFTAIAVLTWMQPSMVQAQITDGFFQAAGSPANPKVEASWNRYYTYETITDFTKELADAHPNLIKRESIGKSYEGRDIWLLTVTNFNEGDADRKPAMYIDGETSTLTKYRERRCRFTPPGTLPRCLVRMNSSHSC